MKELAIRDDTLAQRLFTIRTEGFGPGKPGLEAMAAALSLPPRIWRKYEAGSTMPATVMVRLLVVTGVTSRWLMTGQGERYFHGRLHLVDRPPTAQRAGAKTLDPA